MRLKLSHQLFLLFATVSILAVGGTSWLVLRQLERGFATYLDELDGDYLQKLVDATARHYRQFGNIEGLYRAGWRELHDSTFGGTAIAAGTTTTTAAPARGLPPSGKGPGPGPRGPGPGYGPVDGVRGPPGARMPPGPSDDRRPPRPGDDRPPPGVDDDLPPPPIPRPERRPPQGPGAARPGDPLNIAPRTALYSLDNRLLGGRPLAEGALTREVAVVVDGKPIAKVVLQTRPQLATGRDFEFLARQRNQVLGIGAGAVLISLLLAWAVSVRWTGRLRSMVKATGALARGDFKARADLRGNDEITELAHHVNEMAVALERLEQARRNWLANIAHELRTPLATLQGELEGLIDGVFPVNEEALKSLHEEVRHLTRLTGDLHQLALSDLGALPIYPERTDLGVLVDRAVQRWQAPAERARLRLVRGGVAHADANVDETRIVQVIDNLLQNSLRYTEGGGEVAVAVQAQPDEVLITVDDSPPGVSEADRAHMFEPLFRTLSAQSQVKGGSGLGLALARAIVEAHRGTIRAEASPLGGLRIAVALPALAPA